MRGYDSVYDFSWYHYLIAVGGGAGIAVITATTEKLLQVKYGEYKKITVCYMAVLGGTLALSFASVLADSFSVSSIVLCVGMVLFIASDGVLSGTYFGEGKTDKFSIVLNHALYYAAQFTIASSVYLQGR